MRRRPLGLMAVVVPLASLLLHATPLSGQIVDSTAPLVLTVPLSARSAGLNGAGAALVGHAGALFANPAGIATVRHISVEGSYRKVAREAYLTSAALAWRIRQFDVGLGVAYFDLGNDPLRFPVTGVPATSHTRDLAGIGTLVYRYGIIAVGGTAKYASRTVDADKDRALSFDGGAAIAIFDIMAIGFSIQNIGGNWRDQSSLTMPKLTRFGFTMNYVDPQETYRLMSVLELQWPEDRDTRILLGAEAGVVVKGVGVIGRGAYGSQASSSDLPRFTYGLSIAISRLSLDYAFRNGDQLEDTVHLVGLRLTL